MGSAFQRGDFTAVHGSQLAQGCNLAAQFLARHARNFILEDGSQIKLTMHPGEYINVPKDTEHWFEMTNTRRIKAVRYFTNTDGWTPRYTDSTIRI